MLPDFYSKGQPLVDWLVDYPESARNTRKSVPFQSSSRWDGWIWYVTWVQRRSGRTVLKVISRESLITSINSFRSDMWGRVELLLLLQATSPADIQNKVHANNMLSIFAHCCVPKRKLRNIAFLELAGSLSASAARVDEDGRCLPLLCFRLTDPQRIFIVLMVAHY